MSFLKTPTSSIGNGGAVGASRGIGSFWWQAANRGKGRLNDVQNNLTPLRWVVWNERHGGERGRQVMILRAVDESSFSMSRSSHLQKTLFLPRIVVVGVKMEDVGKLTR
jgi:hypothetical protein